MFASLTPSAVDSTVSTPATPTPPTPQALASLGVSPFNPASFMAAFNNSLMASKLASAFAANGSTGGGGGGGGGKMPNLPNLPNSLPTTPTVDSAGVNANAAVPPPATKRKRQRRFELLRLKSTFISYLHRNPVWPYFDVVDGTARCKQCMYSTKSVFSTNLKVHLRSHHRADYEKVWK